MSRDQRYLSKERQSHNVDMMNYGDVPLNQLYPGRIVYAHVAFRDDGNIVKTRPVVVIERRGRGILGCPMYTKSSQTRIETERYGRRTHVDLRSVEIDRYNLVNIDPVDIDDETWDYIADHVIFPEEQDVAS
jgi:hypothetical protein